MEEITKVQKSYSIPDVELRESLKRDNKEYILPKYNAFYERFCHRNVVVMRREIFICVFFCRYASLNFTKNPEKYVKFTAEQVSSKIDSFFDVAA